jgi:hypothetical protein
LSISLGLSLFETVTLMRISASTSSGFNLHPRDTGAGAREHAEQPVRAALPAVVVEQGNFQSAEHGTRARTHAQFLAQLVAGIEDMPTTRIRRRADPETAIASYRSTAALAGELPHLRIRSI